MPLRPAALLLVSIALWLAACGGTEEPCVCPASRTLNIGHRGSGNSSATNPLPENTVASVEAAMDAGADGVEIDVQLSADGMLVLMHDFTVDHTTDGTGCVGALTLEELKALDAGYPSSLGAGIEVPTLLEVLDGFDEGLLDIELKVGAGHETCPDTDRAATVAALLADLGDFPRERLVVSSFDAEILALLRGQDDSIAVALLGFTADTLVVAETEGFDAAAIAVVSVTPALVEDARMRGIELWTWTLDDEVIAETLIDAEIDGIITNDVAAVGAVKERLCADFVC